MSSTVASETSPVNGIIKTEPGVVKTETFDDSTTSPLDQLLNSTQSQLFLFQLPDTLPGRIQDSDDFKKEKDETKTEPSVRNIIHRFKIEISFL